MATKKVLRETERFTIIYFAQIVLITPKKYFKLILNHLFIENISETNTNIFYMEVKKHLFLHNTEAENTR